MQQNISNIIGAIEKGEIRSVIVAITCKELDKKSATRIVMDCCKTFCHPRRCILDEEKNDLVSVIIICMDLAGPLTDDQLLFCYLQVSFYILNFLKAQKAFKRLVELGRTLIPPFVKFSANMKIINTHATLCNIVHNTIVELLDSTESGQSELLYRLSFLSLQMKNVHLPATVSLAKTALSYINAIKFNVDELNLVDDFYINIVDIIKASVLDKNDFEDAFPEITKILQFVVKFFFKAKSFQKIQKCTELIMFDSVKNNPTHTALLEIINSASGMIIKMDRPQDELVFKKNLKNCYGNLKKFMAKFEREHMNAVCYLLYVIFTHLSENLSNSEILNITDDSLIGLCQLLGGISQIVSNIQVKCLHCECSVKTNLNFAINIIIMLSGILRIAVAKQLTISKQFFNCVHNYLKKCFSFVKELKIKECSTWTTNWTRLGAVIFNIALELYNLKRDESCDFFLLVISSVIELEGTTSSVIRQDLLYKGLSCLSEMKLLACQFEEALVYAAVEILFNPEPSNAFYRWVRIKSKYRETQIVEDASLQESTVVCIIKRNVAKIREFYPEFDAVINSDSVVKILTQELLSYKKLWPSKIILMSTFKMLRETADELTVVETLIQLWGESLDTAHDDVCDLLQEVIDKFKKKPKNQFYLACLNGVEYYVKIRKAKRKIAEDMSKITEAKRRILAPHELPQNPNDECDLVSSYKTLSLDEHINTMTNLNKALSIYQVCIPNLVVELIQKYNVYAIIAKIAHEYRLQRDSVHATKAWLLCVIIARLLQDDLHLLESISFLLLEEVDINSETIKELLIEAESLKLDNSSKAREILTTYYANKSALLLRHQKLYEGFDEYKKAIKYFSGIESKVDDVLKIRLDFLHVKYLQLPCELRIDSHVGYSPAKFVTVLNDVTTYFKNAETISSFTTSTLFEVNQSLAKMYNSMFLPREVRCYCQTTVLLAQQLVLPLQVADFLICLADADLQSLRLDDCQIKLNGLADILCLDNNTNIPSLNDDSKSLVKKDNCLILADNFSEMVLDCPTTSYKLQPSCPGSPELFIKLFDAKSFLKHPVTCECFRCISCNYKNLVLQYLSLQAQLHIHRRNTTAANHYFKEAMYLYTSIFKSDAYKLKITSYLNCCPLYNLKEILSRSYCALLLHYTDNLIRNGDTVKAEIVNRQLVELITQRKYEDLHLYNAAIFQNLLLVAETFHHDVKINPKLELDANNELMVDDVNEKEVKTPENRKSKIIFPKSCSPRINSPPKYALRRKKCYFPETIINPIKYESTEYTEPVLQEIPNSSNVIPSSPNAYTPQCIKAVSALQCRTKLLTKRLKTSTVKKSVIEVKSDDVTESKTNSRICKNLMSELCEVEKAPVKKRLYRKKM